MFDFGIQYYSGSLLSLLIVHVKQVKCKPSTDYIRTNQTNDKLLPWQK